MQITEQTAQRLLHTVLPPIASRGSFASSVEEIAGTIVIRAGARTDIQNFDAYARSTAKGERKKPSVKRSPKQVALSEVPEPLTPSTLQVVIDDETRNELLSALANLTPTKRKVLLSAYGAFGSSLRKIKEIAEEMRLSEARIRQIRDDAIRDLHSHFHRRIHLSQLRNVQ